MWHPGPERHLIVTGQVEFSGAWQLGRHLLHDRPRNSSRLTAMKWGLPGGMLPRALDAGTGCNTAVLAALRETYLF
jgi:hypothetical protein